MDDILPYIFEVIPWRWAPMAIPGIVNADHFST
jgi:hypothetical protein